MQTGNKTTIELTRSVIETVDDGIDYIKCPDCGGVRWFFTMPEGMRCERCHWLTATDKIVQRWYVEVQL